MARLIDAAMEQQRLIKENADLRCAARFWEESADSLAEQLYQKDLKLDNARGQHFCNASPSSLCVACGPELVVARALLNVCLWEAPGW